ncbi:MAG: hypothetical protein RLZZ450_7218 [Pseudomonadota bacterium]
MLRALLAVSGLCAAAPLPADAQSGDEVIVDPDLESAPTSTRRRKTKAQASGAGDDEVIADPELEETANEQRERTEDGWAGAYEEGAKREPLPKVEDSYDPQANTGIAHLEAVGQFGADMHHEGNLEDAYETRLRFDAEIEFRRSRKLRLSVGLRTDLLWAMPARDDSALNAQAVLDGSKPPKVLLPAQKYRAIDQDRFELDLLPLSAFVDVTPANGFHLRIGTQAVSMARMDFYSPNDILAAYDLRGQPKIAAGGGRLSQPAVRMDWDMGSWATLQIIYLPWFMPNLSRPNRDRYVARVLGTGGIGQRTQIEELVDPSWQTKASESSARFVGPAPDFTTPQAQARLNMRGRSFEFAFNGGTAIEKLPSFYLTPIAEKSLQGDVAGPSEVAGAIVANQPVVDVEFHRYEQVGIDGSFDISPISMGFELAWSPARSLVAASQYVVQKGKNRFAAHLPQPNVTEQIRDPTETTPSNVTDKKIRRGVPVVQAALHFEYLKGETIVIGAEAFLVKALELPYDKTRDWWGFIPGTGIFAGGLVGASYRPNPNDNRWSFDLSLVSMVGPSIIAMPQIEYRATDSFYMSVGAQIFEGPKQTILGGAQTVNAGGLYSGYDQILVGFRYLP